LGVRERERNEKRERERKYNSVWEETEQVNASSILV
jgi:hypothetical protein